MEAINNLLHYCYDNGLSQPIYDSVVAIAFVVQMIFLIFYRKKYELSFKQSVFTVLIVYPVTYYLMLVLAWVENGFTGWGKITS